MCDFPKPNKRFTCQELIGYHWELPLVTPQVNQTSAVKWARLCLDELSLVFCVNHCVSERCVWGSDTYLPEKFWDEEECWKKVQYELHKAFAYIPELACTKNTCAACEIVKAFSSFRILANHFLTYYDDITAEDLENMGENESIGLFQLMYPCHLPHGWKQSQNHLEYPILRVEALLTLEPDDMPPISPDKADPIFREIWSGQSIAKKLVALAEGKPQPEMKMNSQQGKEEDRYALKRISEQLWRITFEGRVTQPDKRTPGMDEIAHLLQNPNHQFAALELERAASGIQTIELHGGGSLAESDAGHLLYPSSLPLENTDEQTRNSLLAELEKLKKQKATASANKISSIENKIEQIQHYLQQNTYAGRVRGSRKELTNAKDRVKKRIQRAIKLLERRDAALGRFLKETVDDKKFIYSPKNEVIWKVYYS